MRIETDQAMRNFGASLSEKLKSGMILTLSGELGAGKTTFAKGLASGFGIEAEVTSPTFTILNVYPLPEPVNGIKELIHVDTYRMDHESDMLDVGINDYLGTPGTLCVLEWPEQMPTILNGKNVIPITFTHDADGARTLRSPLFTADATPDTVSAPSIL